LDTQVLRAFLFAGDVPAFARLRAIKSRSTRSGAGRKPQKIFPACAKAGRRPGRVARRAPARRMRRAINAPDQWG